MEPVVTSASVGLGDVGCLGRRVGLPVHKRPAGFRRLVGEGKASTYQCQRADGPPLLHPVEQAVCFEMANNVAVHCISLQGTSRSERLLSLSEKIFHLAAKLKLYISASFFPGAENVLAGALSRFRGSSVEWQLWPERFAALCKQWGSPEVYLFASKHSAQLHFFLTKEDKTSARGPDAFKEDWNRWYHVYLFSPPCTNVLLKVCNKLRLFKCRVTLVAPFWPAQPWLFELRPWCLSPVPLERHLLQEELPTRLRSTLKLHV